MKLQYCFTNLFMITHVSKLPLQCAPTGVGCGLGRGAAGLSLGRGTSSQGRGGDRTVLTRSFGQTDPSRCCLPGTGPFLPCRALARGSAPGEVQPGAALVCGCLVGHPGMGRCCGASRATMLLPAACLVPGSVSHLQGFAPVIWPCYCVLDAVPASAEQSVLAPHGLCSEKN